MAVEEQPQPQLPQQLPPQKAPLFDEDAVRAMAVSLLIQPGGERAEERTVRRRAASYAWAARRAVEPRPPRPPDAPPLGAHPVVRVRRRTYFPDDAPVLDAGAGCAALTTPSHLAELLAGWAELTSRRNREPSTAAREKLWALAAPFVAAGEEGAAAADADVDVLEDCRVGAQKGVPAARWRRLLGPTLVDGRRIHGGDEAVTTAWIVRGKAGGGRRPWALAGAPTFDPAAYATHIAALRPGNAVVVLDETGAEAAGKVERAANGAGKPLVVVGGGTGAGADVRQVEVDPVAWHASGKMVYGPGWAGQQVAFVASIAAGRPVVWAAATPPPVPPAAALVRAGRALRAAGSLNTVEGALWGAEAASAEEHAELKLLVEAAVAEAEDAGAPPPPGGGHGLGLRRRPGRSRRCRGAGGNADAAAPRPVCFRRVGGVGGRPGRRSGGRGHAHTPRGHGGPVRRRWLLVGASR